VCGRLRGRGVGAYVSAQQPEAHHRLEACVSGAAAGASVSDNEIVSKDQNGPAGE